MYVNQFLPLNHAKNQLIPPPNTVRTFVYAMNKRTPSFKADSVNRQDRHVPRVLDINLTFLENARHRQKFLKCTFNVH